MEERTTDLQIEVSLTPTELELLRTALGHLEATLGREEADELDSVQRLIAKLERARR